MKAATTIDYGHCYILTPWACAKLQRDSYFALTPYAWFLAQLPCALFSYIPP